MPFFRPTDPLWDEVSSIVEDEGVVLYDLERTGANALRVTISQHRVDQIRGDQSRGDQNRMTELVGGVAETGESAGAAVQAGVSSEDCTKVCRRLMVFFLAEGEKLGVSAEPELDVCSPGVNRELRLPEHFSEAVGERVKVVRAGAAVAGDLTSKTVIIGTLQQAIDQVLVITDEESKASIEVRTDSIKRANVEFSFSGTFSRAKR